MVRLTRYGIEKTKDEFKIKKLLVLNKYKIFILTVFG